MFRLLSLEYKKFRKNSVVGILTLFYIILAPTLILVAKEIFKSTPDFLPSSNVFFEFPTIWDYMGYIGNWLTSFFLGFVVIYMITSEVASKTMRQSIINGLNRKDYFLGKVYTILTFSAFATLIYIISTIIIGIIHTDGFDLELIMDSNWAPFRYFLMCMGYMSFALLIGFTMRKSGLAIFFYLVYVMMLEVVLRYIQVWAWPHEATKWWPMNIIEDLMPNPFLKLGDKFIKNEYDFGLLVSNNGAIIGSILYTILFLGIAWYSFSKRDI